MKNPTDAAALARQDSPYGFYGTLRENTAEMRLEVADLDTLFNEAARQIVAIAACTLAEATEWLDSKAGRHLADEISGQVLADEELELGNVSWLRKQLRMSFTTNPKAMAFLRPDETELRQAIGRGLRGTDLVEQVVYLAQPPVGTAVGMVVTMRGGKKYTLKITEAE